MQLLERIHIPRRLSPRVWLISLPSALLSFERRQKLPKLPLGRARLLGLPVIGAGVGLLVWAARRTQIDEPRPGRLSLVYSKPGTLAGVLLLGGISLLLRSLLLGLYSLGIALAAGSGSVEVEEPHPEDLIARLRRGTDV